MKIILLNNVMSVIEHLEHPMLSKHINIICIKGVNVNYVDKVCVTHFGSKGTCQLPMGLCLKVQYSVLIVHCFLAQKELKIIMLKSNMLICSKFKLFFKENLFNFLKYWKNGFVCKMKININTILMSIFYKCLVFRFWRKKYLD